MRSWVSAGMHALDPHDRVVESIENRGKVVERASHDLTESGTFVFYLPKNVALRTSCDDGIGDPTNRNNSSSFHVANVWRDVSVDSSLGRTVHECLFIARSRESQGRTSRIASFTFLLPV